jgi:hypothetical protein
MLFSILFVILFNTLTLKILFIMKKCFLLLFVLTAFSSFAQTDFSTVSMKTDAEFKAAEKYALEASNYILSGPLDLKNAKQGVAVKFILDWEVGTPDYSFILDAPVMEKLVEENKTLMGVYLAGMAKFSLENPTKAENPKLVVLNSMKTLLAYVEKPENKVTISETLKKLIEANKKGTLEKELE